MKLLVTGGAGYIGSIVSQQLLEAGHQVAILDKAAKKPPLTGEVTYVQGNIVDLADLFSANDQFDALLHFGAYIEAGESVTNPEKYWENNTVGSLRLITAMRAIGIRQLIFSSTAAVYGNPTRIPITEDDPKDPTNPYGMSKLAVDMIISSECQAHGLAATSLRYFNVAGAYGNLGELHNPETHLIPLLLQLAAGDRQNFSIFGTDYPTKDGTCVRDYIHVADLARAHLLALEHLSTGQHSIYNLGNGKGFSNKEVVAAVERVTGKTLSITGAPRRAGDPAVLIASSTKAHAALGWKSQKPALEAIIKDAWNFYTNHRAK